MSKYDFHTPVLLKETIDLLNIKTGGIYVDATLGGGGHTREMLRRIESGKIFVFDQDYDAIVNAPKEKSVIAVHANFRYLANFLKWYGVKQVDGIIADLGVSSYQIDTPSRGFSFMQEGPLDMRMNKSQQLTAADIVQYYSEEKLQYIFQEYGELQNAITAAKLIVSTRAKMKIEMTQTLSRVMERISIGNVFKYLSKVFQAIRIEVNQELDNLQKLLRWSNQLLNPQGKLAVIAFHSLEDRIVKHHFKNSRNNDDKPIWQALHPKNLVPSADEKKRNKRSRSAKLRVAARIG